MSQRRQSLISGEDSGRQSQQTGGTARGGGVRYSLLEEGWSWDSGVRIVRFSVSVVCALHLHLILPAGDWVTGFSEKRRKGPWLGALIWHHYFLMTVYILTKANGRGDRDCAQMGRGILMGIMKRQ
jgi:hypothetical protein